MLKKLFVSNYALIRELELSFDKGLTIITGETGAGKSIILGALSLILGARADSSALLDKDRKCIVEGEFSIKNSAFRDFFDRNELDANEPSILRREITPNGRSRAFINDTPVTLDLIKEIAAALIDVHSQHQTLLLSSNAFQLNIIDSFASHNRLLSEYKQLFTEYSGLKREYNDLIEKGDQNKSDLDYYTFQLSQLEEEKLIEGEELELKNEQELLTHAGEIHDSLIQSSGMMSNSDQSAVNQINELRRLLERIVPFFPNATAYLERIESVLIELNDLGNEMERQAGSIEADDNRLQKLNDRLDSIYGLMQKHRVEDIKSLIDRREEIREIVSGIETNDERLIELSRVLEKNLNELNKLAREISENRNKQVPHIEEEMNRLLVQLGMPNGRFEVKVSRLDDFNSTGMDKVDLLFSANKQTLPENIARVASGGELSRVMLSLKSLLNENRSLPTIFFDEIDSGVSGEVATKVGNILAAMGENMQVINITHLPQVAAHATMHYYVYKKDEGDSTITYIKLLNKKERLNEVARLLSGNEITKASLDKAQELITGV